MKLKRPTKKQQMLIDFVKEFTSANNYSPSYREIMHAMNLKSVSAVAEHVENCVAAGFLQKVPNSARSLQVVPQHTYKETTELFSSKIAELSSQNVHDPQIQVLKSAADILGIEL